jgi:hypothetical protein
MSGILQTRKIDRRTESDMGVVERTSPSFDSSVAIHWFAPASLMAALSKKRHCSFYCEEPIYIFICSVWVTIEQRFLPFSSKFSLNISNTSLRVLMGPLPLPLIYRQARHSPRTSCFIVSRSSIRPGDIPFWRCRRQGTTTLVWLPTLMFVPGHDWCGLCTRVSTGDVREARGWRRDDVVIIVEEGRRSKVDGSKVCRV